jgi:hypothetical protein
VTGLLAARASGRGRTLSTGVLVAAATVFAAGTFSALWSDRSEQVAWDFRNAYLGAAAAILDGSSPYPAPDEPAVEEGRAYVYTPQLALALTPFTLVDEEVAAALAFLGTLAALLGAAALVGLRDARCYAVVLLWAPTFNELETANASVLLALGLAVAWRSRGTAWRSPAALGAVASLKLLLWPLAVWLGASRGWRAALRAALVAAALTFGAWAAIGFAGLTGYAGLLRSLSDVQGASSYSFVGVAAALGLPVSIGWSAALATGAALLVLAVLLARRQDDVRSFTSALGAALALSPIVSLHYLVLLLVPLAVARPRFSALWLLPLLLWLSPRAGHGDGVEPFLPALVVTVMIAALLSRSTARVASLGERS